MRTRAALYGAAGDRVLPRLIHVMDREGDAYEVYPAQISDWADFRIWGNLYGIS